MDVPRALRSASSSIRPPATRAPSSASRAVWPTTARQTAKLHTATHLLHAALRKVLGDEVAQKGSNITAERLRFDFTFGRKMTKEELAEVEKLVNEAIQADGAGGLRGDDRGRSQGRRAPSACSRASTASSVKVYTMGDYSKEICGGPHAEQHRRPGATSTFRRKRAPLPACAASRPC